MKIASVITILCISLVSAHAEPEQYHFYKKKIDHLENSIIQDFSIDIPKNKQEMTLQEKSHLATQIEVKYGIQTKLFYKIEEEFDKIEKHLNSDLLNGSIDQKEADKLKNSMQYAKRIILHSRKAEINEIYSQFKSSLNPKPRLTDVYNNIHKLKEGNLCKFEKIFLDDEQRQLSFVIKQKDETGRWLSSEFAITDDEVSNGQLITRVNKAHQYGAFHLFTTSYVDNNDDLSEAHDFNIMQDETGTLKSAKFGHQTEKPLFTLFGYKFGSEKIFKSFNCLKGIKGPSPASVKNETTP